MGCNSSKDVMKRIKKQEEKIDSLIKLNQELEQKLGELPLNTNSDGRHANETNDLTNLKTTIDFRFNKLEKTVGKIHNELRLKLFEGIADNLGPKNENNDMNGSLSLNFEKEKRNGQAKKGEEDMHWKDILNDSAPTANRIFYNPDDGKSAGNGNKKVAVNFDNTDKYGSYGKARNDSFHNDNGVNFR